MEWNKTYHRRKICIIFFSVVLMSMVLCGRLVYLMIFEGKYYETQAKDLQQRERKIKAARGKILDRNGVVLADNKSVCTISVIHNQIKEPEAVIAMLVKELGIPEEKVRKRVEKYSSLEKIFIEERIYKDKEFEESESIDQVVVHVRKRLEPFLPELIRPVTDDDIKLLLEIKMKRILKFNSEQAENYIKGLEEEIARVKFDIEHIIPYSINYYENIKKKYGKGRERLTEIRNFENIEATKVVVANEKLYINREEGFIGTALKKDEFICECSDIDDVIVFRKDGTYYVTKVADKLFVGKDVLYVNVFKKNDKRTIYNVAYRDGKVGPSYVKRFFVTGTTRDKQYNLTKGTQGSRVLYFSANPNGEAEVIKVCLKPKPGMKKLVFEYDFAGLAIKGRDSQGNVLSKNDIHKISLVQKGASTLGGRKIWIDEDVLRLNTDGRGRYLGEFQGEDRILVVNKNGTYYTTDYDLSNHYEEGFSVLEKSEPEKVWSAVFFDAEQQFYYLKRFRFENVVRHTLFIGETEGSYLVALSGEKRPRFEVVFGGRYESRPAEVIVADEFIAEKSYKARGKRVTTYEVKQINEIEPLDSGEEESEETASTDIDFEITNPDMLSDETQMKLDFE